MCAYLRVYGLMGGAFVASLARAPPGASRSSIHPTSWKGISANFVLTEFYEVRLRRQTKGVVLPAEVGVQEVVETLVVGREEPL